LSALGEGFRAIKRGTLTAWVGVSSSRKGGAGRTCDRFRHKSLTKKWSKGTKERANGIQEKKKREPPERKKHQKRKKRVFKKRNS